MTIPIDDEHLPLGTTEEGDQLTIPVEEFNRLNIDVLGAAGTGKSSWIEYIIRFLMSIGFGCAFFDWHGTTWRNLLAWCAFYEFDPGIIPISLSGTVLGLSIFVLRGSAHAQAERLLAALEAVYTMEKTAGLRFRRIGGLFLRYCLVSGKLPHEAMEILDYHRKDLRKRVAKEIGGDDGREWLSLNDETASSFSLLVESTKNRIGNLIKGAAYPFLTGTISVRDIMDDGKYLLVDAHPSDTASDQSCRDGLALAYSEFSYQASSRNTPPIPYKILSDEAASYVPVSAGGMLDQLRKWGVFQAFIHHRPGQGTFEDPQLQAAVDQQTALKVVFGRMGIKAAYEVAQTLFASEINDLIVKDEHERIITELEPEERIAITTDPEGGERVTKSPGHAPKQRRVLDPVYYSRDEKIHLFVEELMRLPNQQCFVQYAGGKAYRIQTPFVVQPDILPEKVDAFIMQCVKNLQGAKPQPTPELPNNDPEDFTGHAE